MPRFLRSDTRRLLRLGKKRRNLQKWRRPKGRHSKIRKKRQGYPISPSIGYGTPEGGRGLIKEKVPVHVSNLSDMDKAGKDNIIIISRKVGAKKRIEMLKKASEKGIRVLNAREAK